MAHEDEKSDYDLVQAYRKGDQAAMSDLVERYRQRLFGFVFRMVNNRHEAEDVFQEVWLRIVKNIDRFDGRCFGAWLFRIARNLIIDRQRARRDVISLNSDDNYGVALQDRIDDGGASPARQAELSNTPSSN
ncbi:MAG: sigma-70 family RNA polymerase sigma factor [Lentisphaerae bacterium]|nr:sigma-70 family RNA polymerase sigma factor [Lentisphaerota bacterium]